MVEIALYSNTMAVIVPLRRAARRTFDVRPSEIQTNFVKIRYRYCDVIVCRHCTEELWKTIGYEYVFRCDCGYWKGHPLYDDIRSIKSIIDSISYLRDTPDHMLCPKLIQAKHYYIIDLPDKSYSEISDIKCKYCRANCSRHSDILHTPECAYLPGLTTNLDSIYRCIEYFPGST